MGTFERKEREKEARKKTIFEAAKSVFFEKGLQASTMSQIAKKAELSKGSLYLYFPSKEELFVNILLEGIEILIERFENAVKDEGSWEKKIKNIGRAYYDYYREYKGYFHILFLFQHGDFSEKISEPLHQLCINKGLSCLSILSQAIKEGMDVGHISPDDPMELAIVLWGSINGIIFLYEDKEHMEYITGTLDNLINKSIEVLMDGLKRRE
ncbi:TetR/AcrR family transcriptional regulator [Thermodesulfobacteriota bacterium]